MSNNKNKTDTKAEGEEEPQEKGHQGMAKKV